jgi:hypothetical protein
MCLMDQLIEMTNNIWNSDDGATAEASTTEA